MPMAVYLIALGAVLVLGRWLEGRSRGWYILLMVLLHTALCGLRHPHLTGDLMKYHWEFLSAGQQSWMAFSKNPGFYWIMKGIYHLSGGNFQVFLLVSAAISQMAAGWIIWKFSPAPWLSYLTLHCLGFYIFGFSAVKQALGMAFVLLSFQGIAENRPWLFLGMAAVAGWIHRPMLAILPAYALTRFRIDRQVLIGYVLLGVLLFLLREQAAALLGQAYYGERAFSRYSGLGGRFFLILLITGAGLLLRGTEDRSFGNLCHLMAVSALLQMLSGFDNVFTRLADVYLQFSVLYIPSMACLPGSGPLALNSRSRKLLAAGLAVCLIWFYCWTNLRVQIGNPLDNYLNFQFFWQER